MDLVETLRNKISILDDGDHSSGLKATLDHIEVAFRHLARGQSGGDETAYTDVIYRTNQAFEGGIKEAYRVLTGNDPSKKTPYKIEEYLEEKEIFRGRVLSQFSNYRTEWRNPSTHDYQLFFDESEAFLAIISVSAFACLLSDQIAAKIAYDASKATTKIRMQTPSGEMKYNALYRQATILIQKFASTEVINLMPGPMTEAVLVGSLCGAFASAMPDVEVALEHLLSPRKHHRADLMLKRGDDKLIIELKRYSKQRGVMAAREQVKRYMELSEINHALLVFMPDLPEELEVLEIERDRSGAQLGILLPKSAIKSD